MVGFLRKKKSDRAVLSGGTVLDRKGKVDNASLLDGDGEPTEGSLYDVNGKRVVFRLDRVATASRLV
ncbi:hypothetical protein JG687_00000939 [Phytophthora cactorum]|uniref:Uncharacterized protein n=1 Tax=Phytophthora cactorum TaxID=29920 RepID=A0A8T1V3H0_9STRA|nr:hypothetical protein JG687_00000939 [Phytophthora cactorum]